MPCTALAHINQVYLVVSTTYDGPYGGGCQIGTGKNLEPVQLHCKFPIFKLTCLYHNKVNLYHNASNTSKSASASYCSCCNHIPIVTSLANTHVPNSSLLYERAISYINSIWLYLASRVAARSSWAHLYWTGVHKEVFHALIRELQSMGHSDTKYVTLEEQLAIFLYTSVTGLFICYVRVYSYRLGRFCNRFSGLGWCISKRVFSTWKILLSCRCRISSLQGTSYPFLWCSLSSSGVGCCRCLVCVLSETAKASKDSQS